jgi:hypothetical protein
VTEGFWLVVCALAAFRLAELVVIDYGPFDVFFNLRGWANKPPTDTRFRGTLAGVLSCIHCAGLWMAVLVGLFYYSGNSILHLVLFIFGIAGLQSILAGHLGRTAS